MTQANHFFNLARIGNSDLDINELGILQEKQQLKQLEKQKEESNLSLNTIANKQNIIIIELEKITWRYFLKVVAYICKIFTQQTQSNSSKKRNKDKSNQFSWLMEALGKSNLCNTIFIFKEKREQKASLLESSAPHLQPISKELMKTKHLKKINQQLKYRQKKVQQSQPSKSSSRLQHIKERNNTFSGPQHLSELLKQLAEKREIELVEIIEEMQNWLFGFIDEEGKFAQCFKGLFRSKMDEEREGGEKSEDHNKSISEKSDNKSEENKDQKMQLVAQFQRKMNEDFFEFLNDIKPIEFCNIVDLLCTVIEHFANKIQPSQFLVTEIKLYLVGIVKSLVKFAGPEVIINKFKIETWLTIFELLIESLGKKWNTETPKQPQSEANSIQVLRLLVLELFKSPNINTEMMKTRALQALTQYYSNIDPQDTILSKQFLTKLENCKLPQELPWLECSMIDDARIDELKTNITKKESFLKEEKHPKIKKSITAMPIEIDLETFDEKIVRGNFDQLLLQFDGAFSFQNLDILIDSPLFCDLYQSIKTFSKEVSLNLLSSLLLFVCKQFINVVADEHSFTIEEFKKLTVKVCEGLKIETICSWYFSRLRKVIKDKKVEIGKEITKRVLEIGIYLLKIILTNTLFFEYMSNVELILSLRESMKFLIETRYGEQNEDKLILTTQLFRFMHIIIDLSNENNFSKLHEQVFSSKFKQKIIKFLVNSLEKKDQFRKDIVKNDPNEILRWKRNETEFDKLIEIIEEEVQKYFYCYIGITPYNSSSYFLETVGYLVPLPQSHKDTQIQKYIIKVQDVMNLLNYLSIFFYPKKEKIFDFKMKPSIIHPLCQSFQALRDEDEEWNNCEELINVVKDMLPEWLQQWDGRDIIKGEEMIQKILDTRQSGCFCGKNCFKGIELLLDWGFWVIGNAVFLNALTKETLRSQRDWLKKSQQMMQIEVCANGDNWEGWVAIGRCACLFIGMMYDELVWEKRDQWLEAMKVYERIPGRALGLVTDRADGEPVEEARIWKGVLYCCQKKVQKLQRQLRCQLYESLLTEEEWGRLVEVGCPQGKLRNLKSQCFTSWTREYEIECEVEIAITIGKIIKRYWELLVCTNKKKSDTQWRIVRNDWFKWMNKIEPIMMSMFNTEEIAMEANKMKFVPSETEWKTEKKKKIEQNVREVCEKMDDEAEEWEFCDQGTCQMKIGVLMAQIILSLKGFVQKYKKVRISCLCMANYYASKWQLWINHTQADKALKYLDQIFISNNNEICELYKYEKDQVLQQVLNRETTFLCKRFRIIKLRITLCFLLNEYDKLHVLWKKLGKAQWGANGTGEIKLNKVYFKLFCMIINGMMQRIIENYQKKTKEQNEVIITEEEFQTVQIIDKKWISEILHESLKKKQIWDQILKAPTLAKQIKLGTMAGYCYLNNKEFNQNQEIDNNQLDEAIEYFESLCKKKKPAKKHSHIISDNQPGEYQQEKNSSQKFA